MFYKINQLIFEFEIFSKGFPTDGALADFQVDARKVVYVIDTHFVGNGKTAQRNICLIRRVVPTSRQQSISLWKN